MIEDLTAEVEIGRIYEGTVLKILDFGAIVQVLPGRDGLLHVSQITNERVNAVSDYLKEGQVVRVKVLEVDVPRQRIALTLRLDDEIGAKPDRTTRNEPRGNVRSSSSAAPVQRKPAQSNSSGGGALAEALRRAAEQKQGKPR